VLCYITFMKINWKIIAIIIVIFGATITQYIFTRKDKPVPNIEPIATTTIPVSGITDPSGAGYVVTKIPLPKEEPALKAPDVISIASKIVAKNDYEKLVLKSLSNSVEAIKTDSENYDAWLGIGISLKQLEKYNEARDVFIYAATLWPQEAVPNGNLGSIYHLYLKDFPKSEAAYKRAIELDPNQELWYRGLSELYIYSYKQNTNAWEETLKSGIENTGSAGLASILAGKYVALKRFNEAVVVYDYAIAVAEKQGNQKLVDSLIAERAAARAQIK